MLRGKRLLGVVGAISAGVLAGVVVPGTQAEDDGDSTVIESTADTELGQVRARQEAASWDHVNWRCALLRENTWCRLGGAFWHRNYRYVEANDGSGALHKFVCAKTIHEGASTGRACARNYVKAFSDPNRQEFALVKNDTNIWLNVEGRAKFNWDNP